MFFCSFCSKLSISFIDMLIGFVFIDMLVVCFYIFNVPNDPSYILRKSVYIIKNYIIFSQNMLEMFQLVHKS